MKKILLAVPIVLFLALLVYADSAEFLFASLSNGKYSSSSNLTEKNKPADYYGPDKAFDEDPATSWCEGKKDDGIGEYLAIEKDAEEIVGINILNGFGKYRHLYKSNNRVKGFRLTVYPDKGKEKVITGEFKDNLCGTELEGGKMGSIDEFCRDQASKFEGQKEKFNEAYFACLKEKKNECIIDHQTGGQKILFKKPMNVKKVKLQILSVYKGEKYSDTCVSELKLIRYNIDFGTYDKVKAKKY